MQILRLVTAFGFVFGLLGLLVFVSRRRSGKGPLAVRPVQAIKFPFTPFSLLGRKPVNASGGKPAPIRVVKRISLTPSHQLHLVSTDSANLLICTHPAGCTVLQDTTNSKTGEYADGGRFLAEMKRHAG